MTIKYICPEPGCKAVLFHDGPLGKTHVCALHTGPGGVTRYVPYVEAEREDNPAEAQV